jgi:hypothetical protein
VVALALLLSGVVCARVRLARAQVSPGALAEAHRDLDGTLNCFKCHGRTGSMDTRCLACHEEIATMRTRKRGLHARVADRRCASCHPDHGGRGFALIAWEEGSAAAFDHRRAGYALEGKHASVECRSCHQPRFHRPPVAGLIRKKTKAESWLGLDERCVSCHQDPHRNQLGDDCRRCHDARGWKPAAGFDHARTDYPLTGRHARVECARCHESPRLELARDAKGTPIPQYRPLPHRDCASCHRDPHAGRFPGACATCHSTEGFAAIDRRGFDHDVTRYPLRGRHAAVACERCHDPRAASGKKPRFARCDDCHRDPHAGQATVQSRPVDCAACHTVQGFHPSSFTVAEHAASRYPLMGAHGRADCSECHFKAPPAAAARLGSARVTLRPAAVRCVDCHRDPHGGRFSPGGARPRAQACEACHGLEHFRPSAVDAALHARFPYPLEGAHRAVPCQACHEELEHAAARSSLAAAATGQRPLGFSIDARLCASCHDSPHGDQFAKRRDGGACEACHAVDAWSPASRFDHARDTRFRLEGAHARVACASCHRSERGPGGSRRVVYRPLATACESCHASAPAKSRQG